MMIPIAVTLVGIVTAVSDVHNSKAESPSSRISIKICDDDDDDDVVDVVDDDNDDDSGDDGTDSSDTSRNSNSR